MEVLVMKAISAAEMAACVLCAVSFMPGALAGTVFVQDREVFVHDAN